MPVCYFAFDSVPGCNTRQNLFQLVLGDLPGPDNFPVMSVNQFLSHSHPPPSLIANCGSFTTIITTEHEKKAVAAANIQNDPLARKNGTIAIRNPKLEFRNPKQIQNPDFQITKMH